VPCQARRIKGDLVDQQIPITFSFLCQICLYMVGNCRNFLIVAMLVASICCSWHVGSIVCNLRMQ
jgi:hypothetical protein